LAAADVGFAMGIAGTEVAKESADIILLDDNFASLVKAVVWGRCVYDAIRKFLQFQLTVNISAVLITIVSSVYSTVTGNFKPESVLTAVQLLWVNLIMDTLAALALATDKPTDALLNRLPSKRTDPIISPAMFLQIVGQAVYQIIVCLVLYFMAPTWFPDPRIGELDTPAGGYIVGTVVFNTFIFCQVFNEINARSITSDKNVFSGIWNNYIFLGIMVVTIAAQAVIVQFGGIVFRLDPNGLSGANWGLSILLGSGSLFVGFFLRFIPPPNVPAWLLGGKTTIELEITDEKPVDLELGTGAANWAKLRSAVRAFRPPAGVKSDIVPAPGSATFGSELRIRRRDNSNLMILDPRRVQKARRKLASRSSSHP
jgi:Ca2+-transporting ATPase